MNDLQDADESVMTSAFHLEEHDSVAWIVLCHFHLPYHVENPPSDPTHAPIL